MPPNTPIDPHIHLGTPADRASPFSERVDGEDRTLEFRQRLHDLDRDTLGRFYELYAARVYRYVRRMLGEDHLAEDVTQDIFMHIQRSLSSYDPARELAPWVYTLATNKVRDFWRSRRNLDLLREKSFEDEDAGHSVATTRPGPMPQLENKELGGVLSKAIDALPEGLRVTLLLRYFEGLSFEAIAQILERNEEAVRKRYSRALAELRRALEKPLGMTEGGRA